MTVNFVALAAVPYWQFFSFFLLSLDFWSQHRGYPRYLVWVIPPSLRQIMEIQGEHPTFVCPHPKSLSQVGRGTLNPAPLLPKREKGLGDEGYKFAKVGYSRSRGDSIARRHDRPASFSISLAFLEASPDVPRGSSWGRDTEPPLSPGAGSLSSHARILPQSSPP